MPIQTVLNARVPVKIWTDEIGPEAMAQLKNTAAEQPLPADEAQLKSRLMQRILINDAEIRQLAEPWLEDLDDILAGRPKTLH